MSESQSPEAESAKANKSSKTRLLVASVGLLIGGSVIGSMSYADQKATQAVDKFIEDIEKQSDGELTVQYDDVKAEITSGTVTIEGMSIKDNSNNGGDFAKADSVSFRLTDYEKGIKLPTSASLDISDLVLQDQDLLTAMSQNTGVSHEGKKIDLNMGYSYDSSEKGSFDARSSVFVEGYNRTNVSVELSSVTNSWNALQKLYKASSSDGNAQQGEFQALKGKLAGIKLERIAVNYENYGELEKMIAAAAKAQGTNPEQIKNLAHMNLDRIGLPAEASNEIKKFIANPKSISLTIKPKEPVVVAALPLYFMTAGAKPAEQIFQEMGITIQAN